MDKIEKLKKFLQENYPNIQAFNNRNLVGDYMETVYDEDDIQVDYAPEYEYIEIFGLSNEEFESLLKDGRLKTFSEYIIQDKADIQKVDIQVGDRITYKDLDRNEVYTQIINYTGLGKDLMNTTYYEIIKIERPKYEVVEEKKELLTKEEKEYLKNAIDTVSEYSGKNIKNITFCRLTYYNKISFSTELFIVGEITVRKEFYNLKSNQTYTLKELGLEVIDGG